MRDNSYPWQILMQDVFAVCSLTLLVFIATELLRPGIISAHLNLPLFFLLIAAAGLWFTANYNHFNWSDRFYFYLFLGGAILTAMMISSFFGQIWWRYAIGLISLGALLLFLDNEKD